MKKTLAALGTLGCALVMILSTAAAPASAATGCSGTGPSKADPNSLALYPTTYCFVYKSWYLSPFPAETGPGFFYTADLYRGRSWFVCQQKGNENLPVGNARNNFWLYTLGDKRRPASNTAWGWFPANRVSGGDNYQPVPGLPQCHRKKGD
jgi:hypothetical protein